MAITDTSDIIIQQLFSPDSKHYILAICKGVLIRHTYTYHRVTVECMYPRHV